MKTATLRISFAAVLLLVAASTHAQNLSTGLGTTFTPTGPVNPPPSNLRIESVTASMVRLLFDCARNAEEYEVSRRAASGTQWAVLHYVPTCDTNPEGVVDGVAPQSSYCYKVTASNRTDSKDTNTLCLNTPPTAAVIWVETLTPSTNRVVIRPSSPTATRFSVEARRPGESAWRVVQSVVSNSFNETTIIDSSLQPAGTYQYRAVALFESAFPVQTLRAESAPVTVTTRPSTPPIGTAGCAGTGEASCKATFRLSNGMDLEYYTNHPVRISNASITRVVLAIHGSNREPWRALDQIRQSAGHAGVIGETLILAPYFRIWGDGWREGATANQLGVIPISSFTAADELLHEMTMLYPNIREVTIAGHSAGGQFTQRYAAMTNSPLTHPRLRYRFVAANPSTYVYIDSVRPTIPPYTVADRCGVTDVMAPSGIPSYTKPVSGCSDWDDYKYGLQYRYGYAATLTADQIRSQYTGRLVTYLLGELDTLRDADLDISCAADLQGRNRLFRGTYYYWYLIRQYRTIGHRRIVVPCAGHDGLDMFDSVQGRTALFFTYK